MSDITLPEADLKTTLGIAPDVDLTPDAVMAAIREVVSEKTEVAASGAPAEKSKVEVPEGYTIISDVALEELREQGQAGVQARARQLADDRDRALAAAVGDGRITPARKATWAAAWDKDPEGTAKELAEMPKGRIPVGASTGYSGVEDHTNDDELFTGLFGTEKKEA